MQSYQANLQALIADSVEEKFDFLRPKGAKNRIFRVIGEMREKNRVYNSILDEI